MADNYTQRPNRSNPTPLRPASGTPTPASGDPLAELARLIGQNDPFAEFGSAPSRHPAEHAASYRQPAEGQGHADEHYAPAPPAYVDERYQDHAYSDEQHAAASMQAPPYGAPDGYPTPGSGEAAYGQMPDAHAQGMALDHEGYEPGAYYPADPNSPVEELDFYDDVPPRRRLGIIALAAVFAVAVVGTAGAFGYHALFGSSAPSGPPPVIRADATPSKIVPAASKDAKTGKLIYDRVNNGGQNEKLVSRQEQPIDINEKPVDGLLPQTQQNIAPTGSMQQAALGSGVVGVEPKKVHTIDIHPGEMAAAAAAPESVAAASAAAAAPPEPPAAAEPATPNPPPVAAQAKPAVHHTAARAESTPHHRVARAEPVHHQVALSNAPLSLNPNAQEPPAPPAHHAVRTATAAAPAQIAPGRTSAPNHAMHGRTPTPASVAPASGGRYAVQIVSRHQEADAKASFRSLQAKYPQQLGGRSPLIRRVDLGAKGVYYRAMVGPFGSQEQAGQMCSRLKAAGGQCFVQRI